MSFSVKKTGKDKEAVKAAVRESIVKQNPEAELVADLADKILDAAPPREGWLFSIHAFGHIGSGDGNATVQLNRMQAEELVG